MACKETPGARRSGTRGDINPREPSRGGSPIRCISAHVGLFSVVRGVSFREGRWSTARTGHTPGRGRNAVSAIGGAPPVLRRLHDAARGDENPSSRVEGIDSAQKLAYCLSEKRTLLQRTKQPPGASVRRAFAIIEYLAEHEDLVSVRALARDLHMVPATAYRFLATLKDLGYVQQDPEDARYQLTLRFAWVASRVLDRTQLRRIAHPHMEQLTAATNETTHLAVIEGKQIVYIDKVDNFQAMRMRSRIGTRGYLHSTAVGKSMLAHLPQEEREAILNGLQLTPLTKNTLTDPRLFRSHLEEIRRRGYAIDDEENEVGIRCIGVPLFDHAGRLAGAVSISGWTITMTPERLPQLAPVLQETCKTISNELGYVPPSSV